MYPVDLSIQGKDAKVIAFAGAGKSTTLREIALALPTKRILYATFGKGNIIDAKKKFPKNVFCSTAHSIAFHFINKRLNLMGNKLLTPSLSATAVFDTLGQQVNPEDREAKMAVVSIAIGMIGQFCRTTDETIQKHHRPVTIEAVTPLMLGEAVRIARNYWHFACEGQALINHDMYLKMWQLSNPVLDYDVILFDEAQDGDALMTDVINKQKCQKIVVGDHHQQIYSFRGAVNALNLFDIANECLITQSFRFGVKTAELCNELIYQHKGIRPGIRGNPALNTKFNNFPDGHVAVIARNTAALFKDMVASVESGMTDIKTMADIENVIDIVFNLQALKKGGEVTHPFLRGFLSYDEFKVYAEHNQSDIFPTYDAIIRAHGYPKIKKVLLATKACTVPRKTFLTAHKSKGLEFESVQLQNDFVAPDPLGLKPYDPEETNLPYVAATRGIMSLDITNCDILNDINNEMLHSKMSE